MDGQCKFCLNGFYRNSSEMTECKKCPEGLTTYGDGICRGKMISGLPTHNLLTRFSKFLNLIDVTLIQSNLLVIRVEGEVQEIGILKKS